MNEFPTIQELSAVKGVGVFSIDKWAFWAPTRWGVAFWGVQKFGPGAPNAKSAAKGSDRKGPEGKHGPGFQENGNYFSIIGF